MATEAMLIGMDSDGLRLQRKISQALELLKESDGVKAKKR
jgi:hypothetical protein